MMRKLIDALGPFGPLDEATLNAGLALISSMQPQSELEALLAVQMRLRAMRKLTREVKDLTRKLQGAVRARPMAPAD